MERETALQVLQSKYAQLVTQLGQNKVELIMLETRDSAIIAEIHKVAQQVELLLSATAEPQK